MSTPELQAANEVTIKGCALRGERIVVCAIRALVVADDRKPVPYALEGDVVGHPIEGSDEECPDGFYLIGHSFKTWVEWVHVRRAWPAQIAPDPCPVCSSVGADGSPEHSTGDER